MGDEEEPEPLLEELFRVRDAMNEAGHQLRQSSPEQVVASLSSVRTASLGVLQAYTEFVELLDAKVRRCSTEQSPHLHTATQQIQSIYEQLTQVTTSAAQAQANIEDLRHDESRG